jgi:restriction system protein
VLRFGKIQHILEARCMAIPDYQSVMLPLLRFVSDGAEYRFRDAIIRLAEELNLSRSELQETLPSGGRIFDNRVGWARTYLKKAGLLQYPKRLYIQVTNRGKAVLSKNPTKIDVSFLKQFPEFLDFQSPKKVNKHDALIEPQDSSKDTPEELLASGYLKLRKQLELDLLDRVKSCTPDFFERMVVRLLTRMGYGGSISDAGEAIGKSGDGGIDGVIKGDRLGLDRLFIQAKKWDSNTVGRPDIQRFVGALHGQKATKGAFITSSTFSKEAKQYAEGIERRVILIDGEQLAKLMVDYDLGVSEVETYTVKKIDSDFFEDEGA